jgi:DNA polymerase elongation subunit (family B)
LDFVSRDFLNENKIDITYAQMFKMYENNELDKLVHYCYVDSLLTLKLFDKFHLLYVVCEGSRIFSVDIHDLYSCGQQKNWRIVLLLFFSIFGYCVKL